MASDRSIRLEGKVRVIGADLHPHAARRIRETFPRIDWFNAPGDGPVHGTPSLRLRLDPSRPEGSFSLSAASENGVPVIEIAGGPFSGVIYGVEELIQKRASAVGAGVEIPVRVIEQTPGLRHRTFWNWDHSTNWDMEQIGVQEIGVMNPYAKPEDGFLKDYKRCIDFMSRNRIAAVTIFGLFRDSHGGLDAVHELCRYANERGVRILPGIAINAYGGVVWEMDHPYNLATWLRKHPELVAEMERPAGFQIPDLDFRLFFPKADYSVRGCPSQPANQQWMEEAVAWLTETFAIGGIDIEAGDYGVCGCALCDARRGEREQASRREGYAESWSHADMADLFPRLYETATAKRPDLWIYSEIQWDNLLDAEAMAPLQSLPAGGVYQHTFNRAYWEKARREMTPDMAKTLPTAINVFRCQFACQWNGDYRTERYRFNGRDFADMAQKAAEIGFDGLTVWGEPSSFNASVELSYLAFARFTWEPTLTWERFVKEDVGPLFGGEAAAERYLEIAADFDRDLPGDRAALSRLRAETIDAARDPDDRISRRWLWLADRIARREYNRAT